MIFISHSSNDDSIAGVICEYLENNDIKCWLDHRDVKPGIPWEDSIISAIKDSDLMLTVFTNHANISKHVGRELTLAAKNRVTNIPIRLEDIKPSSKFEYYLDDIQWYNAIGVPLENHLNKLLDLVNEFLSQIKGKTTSKPVLEREFFRGIYLPKKEAEFLKEVEFITDESFEYVKNFDDIVNTEFRNLGLLLSQENTVEGIGIRNCKLEEIPESMRNIHNLNVLILDDTNLKSIPEWFSEFKHLDFLSFHKNDLNNIPFNFSQLDFTGVLDLSYNEIYFLPESFGNMELQYLDLSNNNLQTLPFSFLKIFGSITLSENPLIVNPDLKTRYIISSLKRRNDNIDIDLPKFKFEFEERDENVINRIDDLINDYYQNNLVSSEAFLEKERQQDKICYELIDISYTSIDRLLDDEFLSGNPEIQSIIEEILNFILCDIEPDWKEIVTREDFFL